MGRRRAATSARVARLGTVDGAGAVRLVPVCFAVVDELVVSAVDHKPKRTGQLRRLDDMRGDGRGDRAGRPLRRGLVAAVVGAGARAGRGARPRAPSGTIALDALVAKYAQYRERPAGRRRVAGGDRRAAVVAWRAG